MNGGARIVSTNVGPTAVVSAPRDASAIDIDVDYQYGSPYQCGPASDSMHLTVDTDTDGDGIPDSCETALHNGQYPCLNVFNADSDGDGFSDGAELALGSNPCDPHSIPDVTLDTDGDGLTDYEEVAIYHTDPRRVDTDNDGADDFGEVDLKRMGYPFDPLDAFSVTRSLNQPLRRDGYTPQWAVFDQDGDHLYDLFEEIRGMRSDRADTDGDGIPDGVEVRAGLNPRTLDAGFGDGFAADDADGDGLSDELELRLGLDPHNPDCDGDGLLDGFELRAGLDPLSGDTVGVGGVNADAGLDLDGDGLPSFQEQTLGSDAADADTDLDGMTDGDEVEAGRNPTASGPEATASGGPANGTLTVRIPRVGFWAGAGETRPCGYQRYVVRAGPLVLSSRYEAESTATVVLRRGSSYPVRIVHQGPVLLNNAPSCQFYWQHHHPSTMWYVDYRCSTLWNFEDRSVSTMTVMGDAHSGWADGSSLEDIDDVGGLIHLPLYHIYDMRFAQPIGLSDEGAATVLNEADWSKPIPDQFKVVGCVADGGPGVLIRPETSRGSIVRQATGQDETTENVLLGPGWWHRPGPIHSYEPLDIARARLTFRLRRESAGSDLPLNSYGAPLSSGDAVFGALEPVPTNWPLRRQWGVSPVVPGQDLLVMHCGPREDGIFESGSEGSLVYHPPSDWLDSLHNPGRLAALCMDDGEITNLAVDVYAHDPLNPDRFTQIDTVLIKVRRPPIVLVHGFNSDTSCWDPPPFQGTVAWDATANKPIATRQYRAEYGDSSYQGYTENAPAVVLAIQQAIEEYRSGSFADGRWAINGVDVVAHSMGAQLVRLYISNVDEDWSPPFYVLNPPGIDYGIARSMELSDAPIRSNLPISAPEYPRYYYLFPPHFISRYSSFSMDGTRLSYPSLPRFVRPDNFGQGDIRRFVAVGAPLKGSPLAVVVRDDFQRKLVKMKGLAAMISRGLLPDQLIKEMWPGVTVDMTVEQIMAHAQDYAPPTSFFDLHPQSPIIARLQNAHYVGAAVWKPAVATADGTQLTGTLKDVVRIVAGLDIHRSSALRDSMGPDQSDLVVPFYSQANVSREQGQDFNGTLELRQAIWLQGVAHSRFPGLFPGETDSVEAANMIGRALSRPRSEWLSTEELR